MTPTNPNATPAAKLHRLGVLFVHGIGEQLRGETLRAVVDPVVKSLDLWLHGAARCRAEAVGTDAAQAWAAAMPDRIGSLATSARIREQALEMAWSGEWSTARLSAAQKAAVLAGPFWSGGATLSDAVAPEDADGPPHSVLHLHTVGEHYDVHEGTALLAECWWARSFVPAGPWALTGWTFRVLPLAVGMHFGDIVRRHFSQAADAPVGRLRRAWHAAAALLALVALLIAVPLTLPIQGLLMAIALLALVPISAVRDLARSLQSSMVGALGDSYLLVASPVSRAMIVGRCTRNLEWLCDRCDTVLLVAHSQGCAVSYLALTSSLPAELREVTWIGSGLRKLEVLRSAERDDTIVTAGWMVATMPFVLWSQITAIQENGLSWGNVIVTLLAVGFYLYGIVRLVLILRVGATAAWFQSWQTLGVRLSEIYATHDPVPHGPLFDQTTARHGELPSQPVNNQASWVSDHTAYWRNTEQVVLPLGLRIAAALGVPVDRLLASDSDLLARATRRRTHRVQALVLLRAITLLGGIGLIWLEADPFVHAGRALMAWAAGTIGFDAGTGTGVSQVLWACMRTAAWVVLPWLALVTAWRGWEAHEQRCVLLRRPPSSFIEFALVAVLVAAAAVPAGRAAAVAWGDPGAGAAIAVILVGSIFVAVMYVLSAQVPHRAFGFDGRK
ncbi:MAG: hypothetical protein KF791_14335 [Verrucomicrobiae bacterium]|nr:hypothetical protein [Verrucomicrobiae bacterium]